MAKIAQTSAKAQEGLEIIETALDRTQSALRAAGKADIAAVTAVKGSRKLLKVLVVLTVLGLVALLVKKMLDDDGSQDERARN